NAEVREIRDVAEGSRVGHLDLVFRPFAGVAGCDIPEVVFTPRSRHRETTPRRRVIANRVRRQAVAVTPDATAGSTPLEGSESPVCRVAEEEAVDVERHPVGRNE